MNATSDPMRAKNLRTVGALAALFFLPVLASFYMYYFTDWRPAGSTAHGQLFSPPVPLPNAKAFEDRWSIVYVGDGCDTVCLDALHIARQTRLLLNKDMQRVTRVLLTTEPVSLSKPENEGVVVMRPDDALLNAFPSEQRANGLFIVDPLGNLVMRYDARENPKGLLEDLKKLLKLSHIG